MSQLVRDLHFAIRHLKRSPGFTLVSVLTLALGIGANTAVFSIVDGVLLRPLPYRHAGRLVNLYEALPERGMDRMVLSVPLFRDYRDRNRVLQGMSIKWPRRFILTGRGDPAEVQSLAVDAGFFRLLGADLLLGRDFEESDFQAGSSPVAVIGYGLWQRAFGGDPEVLGQTIRLSGTPHTVIGVVAPGMEYPEGRQLWTPAVFPPGMDDRRSYFVGAIGRLKEGVSLAEARQDLNEVALQVAEEFPNLQKGKTVLLEPLFEDTVGHSSRTLLTFLGAVFLVLLIACTNVANLALARSVVREREVVIRAALGASRGRLMSRLLTESLLTALLGGLLGILVARVGLQILLAAMPQGIPRSAGVQIDFRVLLFCLGLSLLVGVLFGILPARVATRSSPAEVLRQGRAGLVSPHQFRLRGLLILVQVAVAVVLLVGAGLLLKSFGRLLGQDPGFIPDRLLTARIGLPGYRYQTPQSQRSFFQQLEERMAGLSGVEVVAQSNAVPLSRWEWSNSFDLRVEKGRERNASSSFRVITPRYFEAMQIPLLRGRFFAKNEPAAVAIVNQKFVDRLLPGEDPLRAQVLFKGGDWTQIVGVVGNVKHYSLSEPENPEIYLPFSQSPASTMTLVLRARTDPLELVPALRREVAALDAEQPISQISTLHGLVSESVAQQSFRTGVLTAFAGVALVLAMLGLYGVQSHLVAARTREIGIRMALGARPRDAWGLVMKRGLVQAGSGLLIGVLAALGLSRVLESMLFEVTATDPATLASVSCLLLLAAALACQIPARRATRVPPAQALRS